nr:unnamed protein product [Callosobruchus chinensis]
MNILVNESPVNTSNKLRQNIINAAKQIIQPTRATVIHSFLKRCSNLILLISLQFLFS